MVGGELQVENYGDWLHMENSGGLRENDNGEVVDGEQEQWAI